MKAAPPLKDKKTFDRLSQIIVAQKLKKEHLMVIHDVDGDGLSSGKILKDGLRKLGVKVRFRFAAYDRTNIFGDFLLEFIQKHNITTIFTTDINLYATNFKDKKELLKNRTFVVFDHHEKPEKIDPNVLYIHPAITYDFPDASQYCSSKLVYDILYNFTDLDDLDWTAAVGIVADANYPTWGEFVDTTLKQLGLPIPKSPFDSELQKVGTYLYYALAMEKEQAEKAIKAYFEAEDYKEALENLQGYEVVGEEIESILKTWKKHAEEHGDVIFIKIAPKYKVNSIVSSKISVMHPNKTIIVGSEIKKDEENKPISFSLRRQDGTINLPQILHRMMPQLPGMVGGGHIPASGARCNAADYAKFKELFLKLHAEPVMHIRK